MNSKALLHYILINIATKKPVRSFLVCKDCVTFSGLYNVKIYALLASILSALAHKHTFPPFQLH